MSENYKERISRQMADFVEYKKSQVGLPNGGDALARASNPLPEPVAPILNREDVIDDLRQNLRNPEKANVILLGEPGTGKTAVVQGFTHDERSSQYLTLQVDVERLAENTEGDKDAEMANGLLDLVAQTKIYSKEHNVIIVLFIDEFHRIAQLSPSSVEALKPILEKSARNGFRVIAATTFEEYDEWIAKNRALDQRLLRMDLPELEREGVISVLKSRANQYHADKFASPTIYGEIYDVSKQYLISNSQPRASIDILLNMIGNITKTDYMENGELKREYFTSEELNINSDYMLSRPMLNRVIQRAYSIDIDNKVQIKDVKEALRSKIFNQEQAVEMIISRLEMALVGFNDPTRPKISFLSSGATGTGKALRDDELIPAPVPSGFIRNGDLKVGDFVYGQHGKAVKVTGVYPKGKRTIYRMTLSDGRAIDSASDHIWKYRNRSGNGAKYWKEGTTLELLEKGVSKPRAGGRTELKYVIPQNEAIQRDEISYKMDPYVLGALLANGVLGNKYLLMSSGDEENVAEVARLIGYPYHRESNKNYNWVFFTGETFGNEKHRRIQTSDIFSEVPELLNVKSGDKYIPEQYKFGSIEQRWSLIQGLFDNDGTIGSNDRANVTYSTTSVQLAHDIQEVLWSLGIMTTITSQSNSRKNKESKSIEYTVKVKLQNKDKAQFFRLGRKHERAVEATKIVKQREKKFDVISIRSIEKLDEKVPMTCIMVDDPEHLYLAGKEHIVTHNTELAKVITEALNIPLKRFDMSRYPRPEDAVEFADELARAAWSAPNGYILIDEAEKSTKQCMNILLQVLDDARLTAANNANRVISFAGNIINLTTNLGSEVYQHAKRYGNMDNYVDPELIYKTLADNENFETAVLGRIDAIVPFNALPTSAIVKIAKKEIQFNLDIVETQKRQFFISPDILPYIVVDRTSNDTESGGARDARRNVKNIAIQKLAHYLADDPKEVPVAVHLDGVPRFRDPKTAERMAADVTVSECYPVASMDKLMENLTHKFGTPIKNAGLFIPKNTDLNSLVPQMVELIKRGSTSLKTTMDLDKVIVIDGKADLDVANVRRFIK